MAQAIPTLWHSIVSFGGKEGVPRCITIIGEMGLCHGGDIGTICEDADEHMFFQEIQSYDSEFTFG